MSGSFVPFDRPPNDPPVWGSPEAWTEIEVMLAGYRGWTFTLKPYRRWSEAWDHDHCISCSCAIAEPGLRDDAIAVAYGVSAEHPNGEDYDWLCPACARELASRLQLRLVDA